jgi:protein-S-isoprenylcysteine O-methyltransferase Ste14
MTRHPVDVLSLAFGLAFTVLGVAALSSPELSLDWLRAEVILPTLALIAGVWILASAQRRARTTTQERDAGA